VVKGEFLMRRGRQTRKIKAATDPPQKPGTRSETPAKNFHSSLRKQTWRKV
jgi:hypothetical protein